MESRLSQLSAERGWEADGRFVTVGVAGGRTKTVRCEEIDEGDGKMLRISTIVGDAAQLSASRMNAALVLNWRIRHGALAIHDGMVVMTDFITNRKATDEMIAEVIQYLAMTADTYAAHLLSPQET